jgi:uncharacterized protein YaiE (UPF0345 family)
MAAGQTAPAPDPFKALNFLEQNWEANTNGYAGVKTTGTYTFRRELGGHILARRSTSDPACKGPVTFDCEHGDILYVYEEAPGQPLKAIYFDNEGHVIHYNVSTPTPSSVVFLSESSRPGPQFRLSYELKDTLMSGKFQMRMPGQSDWKSYLEWSGTKK